MNKKLIIGIIAVAVLGLGFLFFRGQVLGEVSKDIQVPSSHYWNYNFFATTTSQTTYATTTSATSTNVTPYFASDSRKDNGYAVIAGAENVTFYFKRTGANGNEGSSTFRVQVSDDGSTWQDFKRLITATTSVATTLQDIVVTSTSTVVSSMDLTYDAFYAVRCIVVEVTDGEHFCRAAIRY